jgi:hypothetical protein
VVVLCLCLVEYICRFGFCYLHQSRSPGHSLCYIYDIVFVVVVVAVIAAVLAAGAVVAAAGLSAQDNHGVR